MFTARSELNLYKQLRFGLLFKGLIRLSQRRFSNYMYCVINVYGFAKL
jgi:hypothetical protein